MSSGTDSAPLIYGLFSEHCYDVFFTQFDFLDKACLSLFISKMLSIVIMIGSLVIKLPQIIKIYNAGHAKGVSGVMFVLETVGYSIVGAYSFRNGFAFSTYGENVFMIIQGWVLVYLVYSYAGALTAVFWLGVVAYAGGCAAMMSDAVVPLPIMQYLQVSTIPIFAASRVPQIWSNLRNGNTGNLAFISVFLAWAGSLARMFTTLQEVDDQLVLVGYVVGAMLNGVLLAQIGWYWKATNAALKKTSAKKSQ